MNLTNKYFSLVAAGFFLFGITMTGYGGTPQEKVDDKTISDWIARISANQSDGPYRPPNSWCDDRKCRDFKVTCVRSLEVSRADELNGITGSNYVGLTFLAYYTSRYSDVELLGYFTKFNGVWILGYTSVGFVDVKNCTKAW